MLPSAIEYFPDMHTAQCSIALFSFAGSRISISSSLSQSWSSLMPIIVLVNDCCGKTVRIANSTPSYLLVLPSWKRFLTTDWWLLTSRSWGLGVKIRLHLHIIKLDLLHHNVYLFSTHVFPYTKTRDRVEGETGTTKGTTKGSQSVAGNVHSQIKTVFRARPVANNRVLSVHCVGGGQEAVDIWRKNFVFDMSKMSTVSKMSKLSKT